MPHGEWIAAKGQSWAGRPCSDHGCPFVPVSLVTEDPPFSPLWRLCKNPSSGGQACGSASTLSPAQGCTLWPSPCGLRSSGNGTQLVSRWVALFQVLCFQEIILAIAVALPLGYCLSVWMLKQAHLHWSACFLTFSWACVACPGQCGQNLRLFCADPLSWLWDFSPGLDQACWAYTKMLRCLESLQMFTVFLISVFTCSLQWNSGCFYVYLMLWSLLGLFISFKRFSFLNEVLNDFYVELGD